MSFRGKHAIALSNSYSWFNYLGCDISGEADYNVLIKYNVIMEYARG
jgi:hypothetical protein